MHICHSDVTCVVDNFTFMLKIVLRDNVACIHQEKNYSAEACVIQSSLVDASINIA